MYAIIETGGKQYKVAEGDIITVEKLGVEAGQEYTFDKVLVLAKDGDVKVGAPYVEGAAVTASVIGDGKAKKVVVYKYKPKLVSTRKTATDSLSQNCRLNPSNYDSSKALSERE